MSAYRFLDDAAEHLDQALSAINLAQQFTCSDHLRAELESILCRLDSIQTRLLTAACQEAYPPEYQDID